MAIEQLSKPGEMGLERSYGPFWFGVSPKGVDKPVYGDDLIRLGEKQKQQGPGLRAADFERLRINLSFEGPKDPEGA